VTVSVIDDQGQTCGDAIGAQRVPTFKSVVHYHEPKPRWIQTVNIRLPIDEPLLGWHVRFVLRHRSKDTHKDKKDRPLALAYLRLIEDAGTIVANGCHDLLVYAVSSKVRFKNNRLFRWIPVRHCPSRTIHSAPNCHHRHIQHNLAILAYHHVASTWSVPVLPAAVHRRDRWQL
jgi:hypothetical protein